MASAATASPPAMESSSSVEASRIQAEARTAVLASLDSAGARYNAKIQRRAADVHANAAALSKQEAAVKTIAADLAKESVVWQKEIDKASDGLKEFGDMQNWAEMMERDFLVLEETLRLVEGGEERESASGGSQWR